MKQSETVAMTFEDFKIEVLNDYKIACVSRECSLLGRREVLTGKAKFGIFGDGKEVPQLAMAKAFREGDFRSGYYRDQTFMMAIGHLTIQQFFAGLYGHTDIEHDPMSAGRQMGGHFATHSLDKNGNWNDLTKIKNSSADISPTAGQMPRLLGLAQASKIYRNVDGLEQKTSFSNKGNEVAWGTIGNASTSEGLFFETINAAGVLQVPMIINVWDDAYGISVPAKLQTTKENISEILKGFQRDENHNGYEIITVKGWDYASLVSVYKQAAEIAREEHVPVLIHVTELTQPQGHSTSGSHERYKNEERLAWEAEFDCLKQMTKWLITNGFATEEELEMASHSKHRMITPFDHDIELIADDDTPHGYRLATVNEKKTRKNVKTFLAGVTAMFPGVTGMINKSDLKDKVIELTDGDKDRIRKAADKRMRKLQKKGL